MRNPVIPAVGTWLVTNLKLDSTQGMAVNPIHLNNRKPDTRCQFVGVVPGHGGEVWFCQHEGGDDVAAYSTDELELAETYLVPIELTEMGKVVLAGIRERVAMYGGSRAGGKTASMRTEVEKFVEEHPGAVVEEKSFHDDSLGIRRKAELVASRMSNQALLNAIRDLGV